MIARDEFSRLSIARPKPTQSPLTLDVSTAVLFVALELLLFALFLCCDDCAIILTPEIALSSC
jgi:hypothetical protein